MRKEKIDGEILKLATKKLLSPCVFKTSTNKRIDVIFRGGAVVIVERKGRTSATGVAYVGDVYPPKGDKEEVKYLFSLIESLISVSSLNVVFYTLSNNFPLSEIAKIEEKILSNRNNLVKALNVLSSKEVAKLISKTVKEAEGKARAETLEKFIDLVRKSLSEAKERGLPPETAVVKAINDAEYKCLIDSLHNALEGFGEVPHAVVKKIEKELHALVTSNTSLLRWVLEHQKWPLLIAGLMVSLPSGNYKEVTKDIEDLVPFATNDLDVLLEGDNLFTLAYRKVVDSYDMLDMSLNPPVEVKHVVSIDGAEAKIVADVVSEKIWRMCFAAKKSKAHGRAEVSFTLSDDMRLLYNALAMLGREVYEGKEGKESPRFRYITDVVFESSKNSIAFSKDGVKFGTKDRSENRRFLGNVLSSVSYMLDYPLRFYNAVLKAPLNGKVVEEGGAKYYEAELKFPKSSIKFKFKIKEQAVAWVALSALLATSIDEVVTTVGNAWSIDRHVSEAKLTDKIDKETLKEAIYDLRIGRITKEAKQVIEKIIITKAMSFTESALAVDSIIDVMSVKDVDGKQYPVGGTILMLTANLKNSLLKNIAAGGILRSLTYEALLVERGIGGIEHELERYIEDVAELEQALEKERAELERKIGEGLEVEREKNKYVALEAALRVIAIPQYRKEYWQELYKDIAGIVNMSNALSKIKPEDRPQTLFDFIAWVIGKEETLSRYLANDRAFFINVALDSAGAINAKDPKLPAKYVTDFFTKDGIENIINTALKEGTPEVKGKMAELKEVKQVYDVLSPEWLSMIYTLLAKGSRDRIQELHKKIIELAGLQEGDELTAYALDVANVILSAMRKVDEKASYLAKLVNFLKSKQREGAKEVLAEALYNTLMSSAEGAGEETENGNKITVEGLRELFNILRYYDTTGVNEFRKILSKMSLPENPLDIDVYRAIARAISANLRNMARFDALKVSLMTSLGFGRETFAILMKKYFEQIEQRLTTRKAKQYPIYSIRDGILKENLPNYLRWGFSYINDAIKLGSSRSGILFGVFGLLHDAKVRLLSRKGVLFPIQTYVLTNNLQRVLFDISAPPVKITVNKLKEHRERLYEDSISKVGYSFKQEIMKIPEIVAESSQEYKDAIDAVTESLFNAKLFMLLYDKYWQEYAALRVVAENNLQVQLSVKAREIKSKVSDFIRMIGASSVAKELSSEAEVLSSKLQTAFSRRDYEKLQKLSGNDILVIAGLAETAYIALTNILETISAMLMEMKGRKIKFAVAKNRLQSIERFMFSIRPFLESDILAKALNIAGEDVNAPRKLSKLYKAVYASLTAFMRVVSSRVASLENVEDFETVISSRTTSLEDVETLKTVLSSVSKFVDFMSKFTKYLVTVKAMFVSPEARDKTLTLFIKSRQHKEDIADYIARGLQTIANAIVTPEILYRARFILPQTLSTERYLLAITPNAKPETILANFNKYLNVIAQHSIGKVFPEQLFTPKKAMRELLEIDIVVSANRAKSFILREKEGMKTSLFPEINAAVRLSLMALRVSSPDDVDREIKKNFTRYRSYFINISESEIIKEFATSIKRFYGRGLATFLKNEMKDRDAIGIICDAVRSLFEDANVSYVYHEKVCDGIRRKSADDIKRGLAKVIDVRENPFVVLAREVVRYEAETGRRWVSYDIGKNLLRLLSLVLARLSPFVLYAMFKEYGAHYETELSDKIAKLLNSKYELLTEDDNAIFALAADIFRNIVPREVLSITSIPEVLLEVVKGIVIDYIESNRLTSNNVYESAPYVLDVYNWARGKEFDAKNWSTMHFAYINTILMSYAFRINDKWHGTPLGIHASKRHLEQMLALLALMSIAGRR